MRARRFASLKGEAWFYITARALKFFAAICSGAFLIGLTYASVENGNEHHTYLILTTIHVIGMGGTRFWDFFVTGEVIKRIKAVGGRRPRTMAMNKTAKNLEGIICAIGAMALFPAVSGCSSEHVVVNTNPLEVKQSGHCYAVLSYAAVFEWIMSIAWLFYMMSTAWDVVFMWEWMEARKEVPVDWRETRKRLKPKQRKQFRLLRGD